MTVSIYIYIKVRGDGGSEKLGGMVRWGGMKKGGGDATPEDTM